METAAHSEALDCFRRVRLALAGAAQSLVALAADRSRGLAERALALARKLEEAHFNLVVLGEFKRGKSTLVSASVVTRTACPRPCA